MKKFYICFILIVFLAFSFIGCGNGTSDKVTFEIERIYITNELSNCEYPVQWLKLSLYDEKNEFTLLHKVFDYNNNGINEFKINNLINDGTEQENIDYFIPNYTSRLSVKNNEILRLNIEMVFMREAQEVNWNLSSFLKVIGNSEHIILENLDTNIRYWLSEYSGIKDYCNINLVINKKINSQQ